MISQVQSKLIIMLRKIEIADRKEYLNDKIQDIANYIYALDGCYMFYVWDKSWIQCCT